MKLELEFSSAFCETSKFAINDIEAEESDFGVFHRIPDTDEEYGCLDTQFVRISPEARALAKYGITEIEHAFIARLLEKGLSYGRCNICA